MPQLIEFHCPQNLQGQPFPEPVPAAQLAPVWLKQMSAQAPNRVGDLDPTVKKCPPFVDALTGGYLIPLVAEVHFTMEQGKLAFQSSLPIVENHPPNQVKGSPFEGRVVVKFLNPYIIKTPPGYSCLFVQPLNRGEIPFYVLSGVVETDTYYNEINFPSVCLMQPGSRATLPRGTPIVQVFPFKRDEWTSAVRATDEQLRKPWKDLGDGPGRYKEHHWQRKPYE